MQSEYIYPEFSDRSSPNVWEENNKPLILDQAVRKKKEIIGSHFPTHVSAETDAKIREQFPIFLSREAMGRE
jgi:trimethylamine--corrinoid protein Co-methyltransferase